MRKLRGINFNYTNRLHLVLVIRIYFDKDLNYPKVQVARILLKERLSSQVHKFFIYAQNQVLYQIQQGVYKF